MSDNFFSDQYDPVQAKFCASLLWLVCRVSESEAADIPPEITSPIEITANNAVVVCPAVSEYLTSGDIYLSLGRLIFKRDITTLWDLIQIMSHHGTYVMDENEEAVTDLDLMEKFPFKIYSHIALMDSLMVIYANGIVSVQDIVSVVRKFSTFNASKELPFDLEDALILWINKINQANMNEHNQVLTDITVRMRRDKLVEKKIFPMVHEFMDCFKDCKSLLSVILYYLPDIVSVDNIKLSTLLTTDDRASNIELFRNLCAEHICTSVFALRVDDFLVSSEHLQSNFLALLCELFYNLERNETNRQILSHQIVQNSMSAEAPSAENRQFQAGYSKSVQHQPLLSKRSKKQFAKFDTELSTDIHSNSTGVHHDDVRQKKGYFSPPSRNSTDIPLAWPEESKVKKQQKISLDFRPDLNSSHRASVHSSSDSNNVDGNSEQEHQLPTSSSITKSWVAPAELSPSKLSYSDGVKLVENAVLSSYSRSEKEVTEVQRRQDHFNAYAEVDNPHQRNIPPNVLEKDVSSQIGNSNMRAKPIGYGNVNLSVADRSAQYEEATSNISSRPTQYGHASNFAYTYSDGPGHTDMDDDDDDDDDVLSTITEGTEPDAPSLYSFHSSSSSASTKLNDSEERLNICLEKEGGGFFIDDFDRNIYPDTGLRLVENSLRRTVSNESCDGNRTLTNEEDLLKAVGAGSMQSVQAKEDLLKAVGAGSMQSVQANVNPILGESYTLNQKILSSVSHEMRGSYTVNQRTMESAMATGIPVITESLKQSLNSFQLTRDLEYLDVNVGSSQEVAAMQVNETDSSRGQVQRNEAELHVPHHDDALMRLQYDMPSNSVSPSSSSGISVDDGRYQSSPEDMSRPGQAIYSSLSEQTDGSPVLLNNDLVDRNVNEENLNGAVELHDVNDEDRLSVGGSEASDEHELASTLTGELETSELSQSAGVNQENHAVKKSESALKNQQFGSRPVELKLTTDTERSEIQSSILCDKSNFLNLMNTKNLSPSMEKWPFRKAPAEKKTIDFGSNNLPSPGKITWLDLVSQRSPTVGSTQVTSQAKKLPGKTKNSPALVNWADIASLQNGNNSKS